MIQPLRKTDRAVVRTIYEALRKEVVAQGYLPDADLYEDDEVEKFEKDRLDIIRTKGFCIDMFNQSSARHKELKDQPRIVMFLSRVFDGEVGLPPTAIGASDQVAGKFAQGRLPGQLATIVVSIHLMTITSEQTYVLNAIWSNVLGLRKSLTYYDDATQRFWVYNNNFSDLGNPIENYTEFVYFHRIPDILLSEPEVIRDNISPIKEINIKTSDKAGLLDEDTIK